MNIYKRILVVVSLLFTTGLFAQIPSQTLDNFTRADNPVVGNNALGGIWTETENSPNVGGESSVGIVSNQLQFFEPAGTWAGTVNDWVTTDISSFYNPVLAMNNDTITWEFNLQQDRVNPSTGTSYSPFIVLKIGKLDNYIPFYQLNYPDFHREVDSNHHL